MPHIVQKSIWPLIRREFEAGEPVKALSSKYGISDVAIYEHAKKDSWELTDQAEFRLLAKWRATSGFLENQGITNELLAQRIKEGLDMPDEAIKKLAYTIKEILDEGYDEESYSKITRMCRQVVKSYDTALRYIQEVNKMVGAYSPIRHMAEGTIQVEHSKKSEYDLTQLTNAELDTFEKLLKKVTIDNDANNGSGAEFSADRAVETTSREIY